MDIIGSFKNKVRGKGLSVVFPEGNDERIIQAARILKDEDIAQPIVLGKPEQLEAAIKNAGVTIDGIRTINPKESVWYLVEHSPQGQCFNVHGADDYGRQATGYRLLDRKGAKVSG
jgi:hypothetical protein